MKPFIFTLLLIAATMLKNSSAHGQATSVYEDFNDNRVPTSWKEAQGYFITAADQRLKVKASKQAWQEFSYNLPLNLTAAPKVSFKIKGDIHFQLVLALVTTESGMTKDNRFPMPLLATIFPSNEYMDISFDFTNYLNATNTGTLDLNKVTSIRFIVDPGCDKSVNIEIDDFRVGSVALSFPRMIAPGIQNAYINQTSSNVMLRGLTSGSIVTATSSNPELVPNPTVGSIGANGIATLTYTPIANQRGTARINVKVSKPGLNDLLFPFDIKVNSNLAPTINSISSLTIGANQALSVPLTGITDGNTERQQTISIIGKSSDQTIIRDADISVDYTNPLTKGLLKFKASTLATGSKVVNITLNLSDDGGTVGGGVATSNIAIPITVYSNYYRSPQISPITSNHFAYVGTNYTTTITGINDGNGGNNIASVIATTSNPAVVATPVVSYTAGSNTATLSYTALTKEAAIITVSVTNNGAPANSNGNTTTTTSFTVKGIDAPYAGYIEDFQTWGTDGKTPTPQVLGADYYSSGTGEIDRKAWMISLDSYDQKWFVEGHGRENTLSIEPVNKKLTWIVDKPATVPNTLAGLWYSPRKLLDLSGHKYLSATLSSTVPTSITVDLYDVNNKKYGMVAKRMNNSPLTVVFPFDQSPYDFDFDFSKVIAVQFKSIQFQEYKGTITITNLKIGNKAENTLPAKPAEIMMAPLADKRTIFSNSPEFTINLNDVFVVKDGINLPAPIALSAASSNSYPIPTPQVSNPANGQGWIKIKPLQNASGTSIVSITATSPGVEEKVFTFTVDVVDKVLTIPSSVTVTTGKPYQTISGFGVDLGSAQNAEDKVSDMGASMLRFDIGAEAEPGLEGRENDNSDPSVIDLSKYKFSAATTDAIKRARELGCGRFIGCVWTPPIWMKGVLALKPQVALNGRNRLLPEMYEEFAEYITGSCLAFKNEFGIDLYSISLQNEPEFEFSINFTATCQYTKEEAAAVVKLVHHRLKDAGLNTKIHGFDQVSEQRTALDWFQHFNKVVPAEMDAFSFHSYAFNAIQPTFVDNTTLQSYYSEAQRVEPKKELWMTETAGWPETAEGGRMAISSIFSSMANGVSAWLYQSINKKTDVMNYHVHKSFAKFVRPGAMRIDANSSDVLSLAFYHVADQTYTIILGNTGATTKQCNFLGLSSEKMYVYLTGPNINTELVDSVDISNRYLVNVPPNSIVVLHNKIKEIVTEKEEREGEGKFIAYPNPTNGEVSLIFPNNNFTEVNVYDIAGKLVFVQTRKAIGSSIETLNLSHLPKGMYIISAKGDMELRSKIMLE